MIWSLLLLACPAQVGRKGPPSGNVVWTKDASGIRRTLKGAAPDSTIMVAVGPYSRPRPDLTPPGGLPLPSHHPRGCCHWELTPNRIGGWPRGWVPMSKEGCRRPPERTPRFPVSATSPRDRAAETPPLPLGKAPDHPPVWTGDSLRCQALREGFPSAPEPSHRI